MITIFTPTYNRSSELKKLYDSLLNQKYKNFEWLIVDDGSEDDTKKIVSKWIKEKKINIIYLYQENGGKHKAFNTGIDNANGELFFCVDSDDRLLPDSLQIINESHIKYSSSSNLAGYVFLKGYDSNRPVSNFYPKDESVENYNEYIINNGFIGDKAEVFITKILKNYRFPIYGNEKFLGEGFLWSKIGHTYNYLFVNKIIYLCEYLQNGLTKSGRRMRLLNPNGGAAHAKEYLNHIYRFKVREKNALLYLVYTKLSGKKMISTCLKSEYKFILFFNLIPGYLLYFYWLNKYLK